MNQTRDEMLAAARQGLQPPLAFPIHYDVGTDQFEVVTQALFDQILERLRDVKIGETEG